MESGCSPPGRDFPFGERHDLETEDGADGVENHATDFDGGHGPRMTEDAVQEVGTNPDTETAWRIGRT